MKLFILFFLVLQQQQCSSFDQCPYCTTIDFLAVGRSNVDIEDYKLEMFNQSVFNDLEDVRQVFEKENDLNMLTVRDELFKRLSQILVKHGMNDIVGATILHNHFYLHSDEILTLNTSVYDDIEFIAYPILSNETEFVPYMFKYEFSDNAFRIYPLQYIFDDSGAMKSKFDIMLSDRSMLLAIGEALIGFDMIDSVGIFIDYYDGSEIINESTDKQHRIQQFTTFNYNQNGSTLITAYSFKEASCATPHVEITQECYSSCSWDGDPNHDHYAIHSSDDN